MKVSIAYQPEEAPLHDALIERIKPLLTHPKVHKCAPKAGFYHTYVTCRNSGKPHDIAENLTYTP